MKKENFRKIGGKLIACLTVLLLLCSYCPIICTIVEATASDVNEVTNEIKQSELDNQVVTNTTEQATEQISEQPTEQPKVEEKETDKVIDIKDAKLKEYLLNNCDKNEDKILTESEMLQITSLTCDYNVKDLTGLEYATNIETIYMYNNQYENMNAVYDLPNLKKLNLQGNNIKNLANFKSANKLEELHINNYNDKDVIDYDYLASLTSLKRLGITDNYIKTTFNISTLSKLTNLESLCLNLNNQIKDIKNIGIFKNLTELDLASSYIEDISPLKDLKQLETLKIKTTDSKENIDTLKELNIKNLSYYQDISDVYIEKGKKTEMDIPTVIQKMIDKNGALYVEDISISSPLISLNKEKTKLILDGTNAELGTRSICASGNYNYDDGDTSINRYVSININYTVHQTVEKKEEVNIPDSELKRYLLNQYDTDGDKIITNYDMLQIKSFNITGNYSVKDLTGLEAAQNITQISLNNDYQDLTPINKLNNITSLNISNDAVEIMSKLTIMNNLTSLYITNYNKQEVDYAYLGTLKKLQQLSIYEIYRESNININDLKDLTNLQSLSITAKVKLDNLETLQQLKTLTSLALHTKDKLENIGFISKLTGLTNLDLSDNMISNITPLRTLTKLGYLNLLKNPINTKESETAQTLKTLKDNGTYIDILETNKTSNIEFKDEKFKEILIKNNNADQNKDNQISIEEMQRLTSVYLSGSNNETISSIEELTYATNINYISISSKIVDITPIAKLDKLTSIHVSGECLNENNLKVLAGLTNLEYLSINVNNNIDNLEMFKNMKKLKELVISNYTYVDNKPKVFGLKGIENFANLNRVSINGSVSNIELLKKLPKLQKLEISEKLYKENGEQLTEKELLEFLKSLKVNEIKFQGNSSIKVELGNVLVGSNKKINLADINNELIKLAFTPGSIFYSEDCKVSYYENNINKAEHPITLDTSKIGEKYLYVYIQNGKFSCSMNLHWKNIIQGDTTKEINIPDVNLKKVLLENHDVDNDKKITEQDMINMQWLDRIQC